MKLPGIDLRRLEGVQLKSPDLRGSGRTIGEAVDSAGHLVGRVIDAAARVAGETIDSAGHTLGAIVERAGHSLREAIDAGSQVVGGAVGATGEKLRMPRGVARPRSMFGGLRLFAAFGIAVGALGLVGGAVLLFEPRRGAQRRAALARRLRLRPGTGLRGLAGRSVGSGGSSEPVALHIETSDRPPFEGIGMDLHAPYGAMAERSEASGGSDSSGGVESAGAGSQPE